MVIGAVLSAATGGPMLPCVLAVALLLALFGAWLGLGALFALLWWWPK